MTGIITGRSLAKIRAFVGVPGLFYAGSHGFDIRAPFAPSSPTVPLPPPAVVRILGVPEEGEVAIVGTLYKEMKLKPSILDEYVKDRALSQQLARACFGLFAASAAFSDCDTALRTGSE